VKAPPGAGSRVRGAVGRTAPFSRTLKSAAVRSVTGRPPLDTCTSTRTRLTSVRRRGGCSGRSCDVLWRVACPAAIDTAAVHAIRHAARRRFTRSYRWQALARPVHPARRRPPRRGRWGDDGPTGRPVKSSAFAPVGASAGQVRVRLRASRYGGTSHPPTHVRQFLALRSVSSPHSCASASASVPRTSFPAASVPRTAASVPRTRPRQFPALVCVSSISPTTRTSAAFARPARSD
jgi:hypothetical protein